MVKIKLLQTKYSKQLKTIEIVFNTKLNIVKDTPIIKYT